MLYKVATMECFADEADRVGVIEAKDISEAVQALIMWSRGQDWGDYQPGEPVADIHGPDEALVVYQSTDSEGQTGRDAYVLRPVGSVFMFLVEDWKLIFE